jgi:hypothetical protein
MSHRYACSLLLCLALAAGVAGYEQRISKLGTWELAFTSRPPRAIETIENGALVNYRYVIYEVKNETSQEIDFFPTFQIETDTGKTFDAQVFPAISKRIQERFGKEVRDQTTVTGVLKPGQSRKGVALWKGVEPGSDVLNVYVGGLSGDLKTEKTQDGKLTVLYRTYKLVYGRPGDSFDLSIDPVELKSTEWVWR